MAIHKPEFVRFRSVAGGTAAIVVATLLAFGAVASRPTLAADPGEVPADPRFAGLKAELQRMVATGELQSVAIGVMQNAEPVWAEAWGWADREARLEASVNTPYGIASVGKAVMAEATMSLFETRRMPLDKPIEEILGDQALTVYTGTQPATVRQLLNMTAGIPHGAITYTSAIPPPNEEMGKNRFIVVFPPGEVFHYSNFSIALLEDVIQAVSGRPFGDYIQEILFAGLGMKRASVGMDAFNAETAARYDSTGARIESIQPFPRSSRQMNASVADLLKFAAFNLDTPLPGQRLALAAESLDALHTQRSDVAGAHMALGWGSIDIGGDHRWVLTSGSDMGVQSHITLLRGEGVAVVVLSNTSGYQADEIAIRATDILVPGFASKAHGAIEALEARSKPFAATAGWTGEWSGYVRSPAGDLPVSMGFTKGGTVSIRLGKQECKRVEEATLRDDLFTGVFQGLLPLEEAPVGEHRIELGLQRSGIELTGFALSNFRTERGKFELPTFIHLQRHENPGSQPAAASIC